MVVGYGDKIFGRGLFITSPDHLEGGKGRGKTSLHSDVYCYIFCDQHNKHCLKLVSNCASCVQVCDCTLFTENNLTKTVYNDTKKYK